VSRVSKTLAWALFAATFALVPIAVALALVGVHRSVTIPDGWNSQLLLVGIAGASALLFAAVGVLVARAEPRNAIGWIFLAGGTLLAADVAAFGYADLTIYGGETWPAAAWAGWFANWSFIPPVFIAPALVAQLFPNGRPMPGPWRWVLGISVLIAVEAILASTLAPGPIDSYDPAANPIGVPGRVGSALGALNDEGGVFLAPPILLASLAALVVRFRRSRGIEREQMKWLAFAGAVPVGAFALSFLLGSTMEDTLLLSVVFVTGLVALMLVPVAVAVAILRYRLYEIDRVISRTLVYASVTLVLALAYVALVLAGQAVFSSVAGGSDLAIAGSTLVVAALFLPLRSRVQGIVDRRFYRRRYDAQRTLEGFGARLRDEIDLDSLTGDLRRVVQETMQPARTSVWLREARP
jgi:hypothetical protein